MISEKIKFAVVGCGNIGKRHLAVIQNEARAELSAFCDIDERVCHALTEQYPGVPAYTDYGTMLRETDAEVISICTPHSLHAPMAIAAAEARKHSLVEKPMALSVADCHRMIETARAHGVQVMVVKQNRFNVPIALTKKALDSGRLGRIFMAQADVFWNRGDSYYAGSSWRGRKALEGGALHTQVSHFLDLLVWWFGDLVDATAQIGTRNHAIEIEDCGSALLRFSSNVIGTLNWTTCVYHKNYEGSITIIGEFGTIKIGGQYLNRIDFWDVRSFPLPEGLSMTDLPNDYGLYEGTSSNHNQVVRSVIHELLHERHDVVEGTEGIKTIQAIELIYQNATVLPDLPIKNAGLDRPSGPCEKPGQQ